MHHVTKKFLYLRPELILKLNTMKKTLLFAVALTISTAMMAQSRNVLIQESFDGNTMPAGWNVMGLGTNNWTVSQSLFAGGMPNELHLYYDPSFNGISRMVMPAVDLTGISEVNVGFKHSLNNYSGAHTLGIATTSDDGATWNVGWSQSYSTSSSWEVSEAISTPDMGQPNVRFCIFYQGYSYNINDWYFDDIEIFVLEDLDLALQSVNIASQMPCSDKEIQMLVKNYGTTPITSVTATYEVTGNAPVSETFETNIASLETATLTFGTKTNLSLGDYHFSAQIDAVNGQPDDDPSNNQKEQDFSTVIASVEKVPMIEHFSASTCSPCYNTSMYMNTFCNTNAGRFTYTKYQMNWPGAGDPYYTAEGGTRRTYYGVNGVPSIFLNGQNSGAVPQVLFDYHADMYGFVDIRGSFAVEGNTITVKADVMPFIDANARVYISVNEKVTTGNVGTNGETSFHHVFMKMLPDAQGSTVSLVSGELQHLEFTQDMSGTHVEEMSDLEVSVWVQNYQTKSIYNSRFAYAYTDEHPYPVENLTLAQEGQAFAATWDAPAQGNPTGYNVYVNGELVAENMVETLYSFEGESGLFYTFGVEAVYADDKMSVKTVVSASSELQDLGLVAEETSVMLDAEQAGAELVASNANHNTQADINIVSIEEVNDEGMHYLEISSEALPFALAYGESFIFSIAPIAPEAKSVAQTKIVVTSDAGTLEYSVSIDGELLSVTELSSKVTVYPNPANDQVRVESNNGIESVMVYDMMGALLQTVPANGNTVNVNLNGYSNGVYFFSIRQSDGTVSNRRVVVSH